MLCFELEAPLTEFEVHAGFWYATRYWTALSRCEGSVIALPRAFSDKSVVTDSRMYRRIVELEDDVEFPQAEEVEHNSSKRKRPADIYEISKFDNLAAGRNIELCTRIPGEDADHSFNGVVFFVHAKGPEDVIVDAFSVTGSLGPTRIFAHKTPNTSIAETAKPEAWELVFHERIKPSNRVVSCDLALDKPVLVSAGTSIGFYIHVKVNHDEGLNYQSYDPDEVIIEDKHIKLLPGTGRCGPTPFLGGWWRQTRGLAGTIKYRAQKLYWSPNTHALFPNNFRRTIMAMLILWYREGSMFGHLPLELVFYVLKFLDWDDFENAATLIPKTIPKKRKILHQFWRDW